MSRALRLVPQSHSVWGSGVDLHAVLPKDAIYPVRCCVTFA